MAEYEPYPDGTDTEPHEFTGSSWYLAVPETGFSEEITTGDIVHLPPGEHAPIADLLRPAAGGAAGTAGDDAAADSDDAEEPAAPEWDIPAEAELEDMDFNQLRSAAGGTPIDDKQGGDDIRAGLNQLREGGEDAVDAEYLRE